jgi:hypothetical protein
MSPAKAAKAAQPEQVETWTWTVRVTDDNTVAYADEVYDAGQSFDAPVAAVEQAVARGLLERQGT